MAELLERDCATCGRDHRELVESLLHHDVYWGGGISHHRFSTPERPMKKDIHFSPTSPLSPLIMEGCLPQADRLTLTCS